MTSQSTLQLDDEKENFHVFEINVSVGQKLELPVS